MPNFLAKLLFVFQVITLTFASFASQAAPVEIRVGIFAPFSNDNAFIGRNMLGAMEMAQEQSAKSNIQYTFYTLDKSPQTPVTAATLQKFINVHHLNVLLTEGETSGIMAAPVAKKNNIIHFNLAKNAKIADGKNNYIAWNADYEAAAILDNKAKPEFVAQYLEMYQSHPVTEAGYAFDVFQILDKSAVLALQTQPTLSPSVMAKSVQQLAARDGLMGAIHADQPGVLYAQATPVKDEKVQTA